MLDGLRFWLDLGLDGFRLDAVPYLFEREGTNGENLPETHEFLKRVRKTVDEEYPDRVLLAEANQWPADVVEYFGDGDECHMAFHFPVMPRMFMALRREEATPILEILRQTPHIPRELPVGPVPAQPRRADARDGHRRGARLHVRGVREGPAHEAQRRHPPPPRAAARRRPRRDRAHARDPLQPPRQPGPLLRRRDRDGRQRLPRRPRRRAHADAVDRRPQRRLQPRGLRAALPAAADGPGLRLPGHQRRGPAAHADVAAALDAAAHRAAQGAPGVRPRARSRRSCPENRRIFAHIREYEDDIALCVHNLASSAQAVELDLSLVRGPPPGRDVRPHALPAHRPAAVPADARAARLLLVPARGGRGR